MGINHNFLELIDMACQESGVKLEKCDMCELGCQEIGGFSDSPTKRVSAKDYFERRGTRHVSIDLNGKIGIVVA